MFKALARKPPRRAPATPSSVVTIRPPGLGPFRIAFAINPATSPRMIHAMMPMPPPRRRPESLAGAKLDLEIAVERLGDPKQGVYSRWPPPAFESGDRRLGCRDELSQLRLREPQLLAPLRDAVRDLREEPAIVNVRQSRANPLERVLADTTFVLAGLTHIATKLYIAGMRYKASALSLSPRHAGLDHLELLERLPAARAVANRAAGRWPEEVVEAGVLRAAVGTAVDGRLDPKQHHRAGLPRRGRGEARLAQLAPPLFRDAIGGPALGRDFDLGLCPESADRLDH